MNWALKKILAIETRRKVRPRREKSMDVYNRMQGTVGLPEACQRMEKVGNKVERRFGSQLKRPNVPD